MSEIFEVRSIAGSDGKRHHWGAFKTRSEAEAELSRRATGKNREWAEKYHRDWWIETIDTTGLFEIPSTPAPRKRYSTRPTRVETGDGTWDLLEVEVLDATGRAVASYSRNYPRLYRTFEPFRQGDRMMALISSDYTATSVMDLATGAVIAREPSKARPKRLHRMLFRPRPVSGHILHPRHL